MAFILYGISTNGINKKLDWMDFLKMKVDATEQQLEWGEGSVDNWEEAAKQLCDAVFEAIQDFGAAGVGNWPAWLAFELARWIANDWANTNTWLHVLQRLYWLIIQEDYVCLDHLAICDLTISQMIRAAQEGLRIGMIDEPSAVLNEVHYYIDEHRWIYTNVLNELTEGHCRHCRLSPVQPIDVDQLWSAFSESQPLVVHRRSGPYTPEWSAPAIVSSLVVNLPNALQIAAEIRNMFDAVEQSRYTRSKIHGVVSLYKYMWGQREFLRAFPQFRVTMLMKMIDFANKGDAEKFDLETGSPSYNELCNRTLAASRYNETGAPIPHGYKQVVFSYLRAVGKAVGLSSNTMTPENKAARISIAVHTDRLEQHMIAFASTVENLTLNNCRLRSGKLVPRPIVQSHSLKPSATLVMYVVVVVVELTPPHSPLTPPSEQPFFFGDGPCSPRTPSSEQPESFFFGGGRPELTDGNNDSQEVIEVSDDDDSEEPTDPRSLVVYDDDFLEIEYNSESDGDVFDDCDSEDGWDRVHAAHREATLGLVG